MDYSLLALTFFSWTTVVQDTYMLVFIRNAGPGPVQAEKMFFENVCVLL